MMVRRAAAAVTALALIGMGAAAAPANAADDSALLTLDAKLVKTLKKGAVKTSAVKPATLTAKTFTFPATLEGSRISLGGGMSMKKGKSVVKVTRLAVDADAGTIDAEVFLKSPAQPTPMSLPVPGLMRISGGTNQLADQGTWTGAKVTLARSVTITGNKWDPAKLLGQTLGIKLKTGATFGTMTITVTQ